MFEIGDLVVLDGARGIIVEVVRGWCHVAWEDFFVSWEKEEQLEKAEQ
ncbi:hypothetical protein [Paenibacillus hamazuiensis]|nr:hypothetical protein [Paenibacillus hamazuiensis]